MLVNEHPVAKTSPCLARDDDTVLDDMALPLSEGVPLVTNGCCLEGEAVEVELGLLLRSLLRSCHLVIFNLLTDNHYK